MVFLIFIADLKTIMATYQFVDEVSLEVLKDQTKTNHMQLATDQRADWPHLNFTNINAEEAQKTSLVHIRKQPSSTIICNPGVVQHMTSLKLLGV